MTVIQIAGIVITVVCSSIYVLSTDLKRQNELYYYSIITDLFIVSLLIFCINLIIAQIKVSSDIIMEDKTLDILISTFASISIALLIQKFLGGLLKLKADNTPDTPNQQATSECIPTNKLLAIEILSCIDKLQLELIKYEINNQNSLDEIVKIEEYSKNINAINKRVAENQDTIGISDALSILMEIQMIREKISTINTINTINTQQLEEIGYGE